MNFNMVLSLYKFLFFWYNYLIEVLLMNIRDIYKLSDEERIKFLKKESFIISNAEKFDYYEDYISTQKKPFLDFMYYLNDFINNLKTHGEISDYVEFRARIKAPSSAIFNDGKKALDDCFGMELICATEDEIDYLLDKFYQFMIVTKSKDHNKDNGYKAKHRYLTLKPDCYNLIYPDYENNSEELLQLQIPLIDFQLKTIEVAIKSDIGSASHTLYKGESKEKIQNLYNSGSLIVGQNLPRMWCCIDGKMKLLSDEQTAKKLYPFLDVSSSKQKHL